MVTYNRLNGVPASDGRSSASVRSRGSKSKASRGQEAPVEGSQEQKIARRNQQPVVDAAQDDDGKPQARQYTMQGLVVETPSVTHLANEATQNEEDNIVSPVSASHTWKTVVNASLNEIGTLHQIKRFVKDTLFPHIKFLTHKSELYWNTKPQSIAQFVVRGLNVEGHEETKRTWWENHNHIVLRELNRKRSDVVAALKKAFTGKLG